MTRLILWRHGRTSWNHVHRIQGQLDSELDEVGLAQAAAAAPALAAMKPDLIVSSDLLRTTRTAGFLADLTGLPVGLDPRLRERHFGRWQGLTDEEIAERYPQEWSAWVGGDAEPDSTIEPRAELGARAAAALTEIAERLDTLGDQGTAVVVTHGGAARAGIAGLVGLPQSLSHVLGTLGNCAFTDLRHTKRYAWVVHAHNVTPADRGLAG